MPEDVAKYGRASICDALIQFCLVEGVAAEDPELVLGALFRYRDMNVDFPDALLDRAAAQCGSRVWTFDRTHFSRMGHNWMEPN